MPDPKFLYGSHYSTPGYVLYYLVRVGKNIFSALDTVNNDDIMIFHFLSSLCSKKTCVKTRATQSLVVSTWHLIG